MKRLDPLTVDLGGAHLIEASAGTGKTFTIALLVLRFVVERNLPISRILVVTYTIAATAELRSRIRDRLRDALGALDGNAPPVDDDLLRGLVEKWRAGGSVAEARVRLETALREFDAAPIFTIHGFCQRVLQEHAFESGVPFGAELVPMQAPLEHEIVLDLWARVLAAEPPDVARRLAATISIAELRSIVRLALSKRRARFVPEDSPDDRIRILRRFAEDARAEARARKEASNTQSFDDLLYDLDAALEADEAAGGRLASRIREEFSAALIDEFQDTDVVQLHVFRRIFASVRGDGSPLFLIGDPKQSIYWFRGADLYAYLDARKRLRPAEHTLGSNWRSDPGLVAGVNALFGGHPRPFLVEGIDFDAVKAERPRRLEGLRLPPLRFVFVERAGRTSKSGKITKGDWANENLHRVVAGEVRRILDGGATIEGRRIGPGDIAVVCRTNQLLREVRESLRAAGIPAVIQGATSVFEDPEAIEMERVVAAMADPVDARRIRSALATSLLGLGGEEIYALGDDEARWDEWVERFRAWHETWLRRGFAAAFREMLDATEAYDTLARRSGGERRLTNFLHLAELLQATELAMRCGPVALVEWLREMRENKDARGDLGEDVANVRLESDVHAVKLVTIHKSKGLEWPIVVCPDLWQGAKLSKEESRFCRYHRESASGDTELVIDLGSPDHAKAEAAAQRERIEEQIRLFYVAVTRARHHCTIFWGYFWGAETSAPNVLLHLRDAVGDDVDARAKSSFDGLSDRDMIAAIEELAKTTKKAVGVEPLADQGVFGYARRTTEIPVLAERVFSHAIRDDWRTSSFTALVRGAAPLTRLDEEGIDRDQATLDEAEPVPPGEPEIELFDFPAGPNAGNCLHLLLETADFANDAAAALERRAVDLLPRFGLGAEWAPRLGTALAGLLETELVLGDRRLALRDVTRRKSEMKFFLPVGALDPLGLAEAFRRHGAPAADPTYAARLRTLAFERFGGFLQGAIDLVFEHEGRWWVVDWKSNHLGMRARDYAPERLVPEMSRHDYFLQAHLYALSVHRHLELRARGYDYDRGFGGVAYLFLRGIASRFPAGSGVFFERPSRALIEELSATLGGRRAA